MEDLAEYIPMEKMIEWKTCDVNDDHRQWDVEQTHNDYRARSESNIQTVG